MEDKRGKKRTAGEAFADVSRFNNFARDGDVDFLLDEGKIRVRVNSTIMKNASPVFAAMLGPNFKEGHALRAGGSAPVEIPLPEDDGVAFGRICRVLHCQADTDAWHPEPREIIKILDVAEKYDLLKGILLSVRVWVDHQLGHADFTGLWYLLLAFHEAQDGELFESISRQLLLRYFGSFVQPAGIAEEVFPKPDTGRTSYRLAAIFEVSRNEVLSQIFRILDMDLPEAIQGHPCYHTKEPDLLCIEDLEAQSKASLHRNDTNRSITQVAKLVWDTLYELCSIGCCDRCTKYRVAMCMSLQYSCSSLVEEVKGLCLSCFDHTSTGRCTNKHGKSLVARRAIGRT